MSEQAEEYAALSNESRNTEMRLYKRTTIIVLIIGLAVGLVNLAAELSVLLIDVVLAITVASAVAPLAERLEKFRVPRYLTVLLVYALVFAFYAGVMWMIAGPLREQAALLARQLPVYSQRLQQAWTDILTVLGDKAALLELHAADFREPAMNLARKTLDVTAGFMGLVINGVLVLFLAAYFVIEADCIWRNLLLWVPPAHRQRAGLLIRPLGARMGGYVRGQMLVSTVVAAFFATAFTAIGLKYSLVLGLLAGILNLIPYVGSLFATLLALFIASTQSWTIFALTLVIFGVEQFLESNFIVPHLLGKQVDMHPLVVMIAILVGGTLAGGVGALAAVPLTGAALFLAKEFYLAPLNGAQPAALSAQEIAPGVPSMQEHRAEGTIPADISVEHQDDPQSHPKD